MVEVYWLHQTDGSFTDAADWSTGTVPGPNDDAFIDATGGLDYTVTASASVTVAGVGTNSEATLAITGGTFTATGGSGAGANSGTISVGHGASFDLGGSVVNNGVILAGAGSGIQLNSATISGGSLYLAAGAALQLPAFPPSDYTAYATSQIAVTTLTNKGSMVIGYEQTLTLGGNIDNAGTVSLAAPEAYDLYAHFSLINISNSITLSGHGLVELSDSGRNDLGVVGIYTPGTLINVNNTIVGAGFIGLNVAPPPSSQVGGDVDVFNEAAGVIDASGSHALSIRGAITNAGLIEDTGAGGVTLLGSIINTGTLLAAGGGGLYVWNSTMTNAGHIDGVGSAPITLINTTITNTGQIDESGAPMTLQSTTIDEGKGGAIGPLSSLVISGAIEGGVLTIVHGGTLSGSGEVETKTLTNLGLIEGGGLLLQGRVINGGSIAATAPSPTNAMALRIGGVGVTLSGGGAVTINGNVYGEGADPSITNIDNTITGGGRVLTGGAALINEAAGVIDAGAGLYLETSSLTNAGLIETTGVGSITLYHSIVNSGAILATGTGGLYARDSVIINSGRIEATGTGGLYARDSVIINSGRIEATGAATITLSNQQSLINQAAGIIDLDDTLGCTLSTGAATIANSGLLEDTGAGGLNVDSPIANGGVIEQTGAGRLALDNSVVNTGAILAEGRGGVQFADFTVTGGGTISAVDGSTADLQGVTLDGGVLSTATGGTIEFNGATSGFLELQGAVTIEDGASTTATGSILNAGTLAFAGTSDVTKLELTKAGVTLGGSGSILIDGAHDEITGASATTMLKNLGNTLSGSGEIGAGSMVLENEAAGVIDGSGAGALTIDTGAKAVTNAGLIEATGAGGVIIDDTVANTGTLSADGGDLTVMGAVSGPGVVTIDAGTLGLAGAFAEHVTFTGSTGVIEMADAVAYTGSIAGFATSGGTSLDLEDIAFGAATKASFVGSKVGGTLTVTDGSNTAKFKLVGDYQGTAFIAGNDGHGGTTVVDTSPGGAAAHSLIAAIAAIAAPAALVTRYEATPRTSDLLVAPSRAVSLA